MSRPVPFQAENARTRALAGRAAAIGADPDATVVMPQAPMRACPCCRHLTCPPPASAANTARSMDAGCAGRSPRIPFQPPPPAQADSETCRGHGRYRRRRHRAHRPPLPVAATAGPPAPANRPHQRRSSAPLIIGLVAALFAGCAGCRLLVDTAQRRLRCPAAGACRMADGASRWHRRCRRRMPRRRQGPVQGGACGIERVPVHSPRPRHAPRNRVGSTAAPMPVPAPNAAVASRRRWPHHKPAPSGAKPGAQAGRSPCRRRPARPHRRCGPRPPPERRRGRPSRRRQRHHRRSQPRGRRGKRVFLFFWPSAWKSSVRSPQFGSSPGCGSPKCPQIKAPAGAHPELRPAALRCGSTASVHRAVAACGTARQAAAVPATCRPTQAQMMGRSCRCGRTPRRPARGRRVAERGTGVGCR